MAQQTKIDSLKVELNLERSDSIKIKILKNLNAILFDKVSLNEALPFFEQMRSLAIKLNLKKIECESYRYITEYYMRKENFDEAKKVAEKSLLISKKSNDTEQILLNLNLLARVYHHFQKYNEAIKIYNEGIELYNRKPTKGNTICNLYYNIGIAYGLVGQNENSINAYLKGLDYAKKLNDNQSKFMFFGGLGWTFISLEQYDKAEKFLLRGLNDSLKIKDESDKISLHRTLGLNYSRWGKFNLALKHDKIALEYFHRTGDKLFEFDELNSIGVIFLKMNQLKKALSYFERAYTVALETKNKLAIQGSKNALGVVSLDLKEYNKAEKIFLEIARDTINKDLFNYNQSKILYSNLSETYEGKKKYKIALKYYKKFKTASDSMLIKARDSKVTEIETKYQTNIKEKENLKLRSDKAEQNLVIEKQKKLKWLFVFCLLAALLVIVIGGYYYKKNKRQKLVIENLQKELHHRIKNNLAIIDTFIEVAKEEFNNTAFNEKLTELQNRVASINKVHQQLYLSKNITELSLKKYVETLIITIQKSFDFKNVVITQHIDDNLALNAKNSFSIGLIINEFLTNSFKYAFDGNAGAILIEVVTEGSNYELVLSDNGKGLPLDFNLQNLKSFGLRIIKLLSEQLNGSFKLDGTKGVKLTIQFPK